MVDEHYVTLFETWISLFLSISEEHTHVSALRGASLPAYTREVESDRAPYLPEFEGVAGCEFRKKRDCAFALPLDFNEEIWHFFQLFDDFDSRGRPSLHLNFSELLKQENGKLRVVLGNGLVKGRPATCIFDRHISPRSNHISSQVKVNLKGSRVLRCSLEYWARELQKKHNWSVASWVLLIKRRYW